MNKKLVTTFALAATLLVGSVASAANWNGLANYPEVPNSANGTETYYFDKASQFNLIDGSRNYVFGINVVNMHKTNTAKLHYSNILCILACTLYIALLQMVNCTKSIQAQTNSTCSRLLGKKYMAQILHSLM